MKNKKVCGIFQGHFSEGEDQVKGLTGTKKGIDSPLLNHPSPHASLHKWS